MGLLAVNPYVRFARIFDKQILNKKIVALDHRAFYCISGKATIKVGKTQYNISKGSFVFWQAGVPYRNISQQSDAILIGCNFDMVYSDNSPKLPVSYVPFNNYNKEILIENDTKNTFPDIPQSFHLPFSDFEDEFRNILKEYTQKQQYYKEKCSVLMKNIIISALRELTEHTGHKSTSRAEKILSYIHEHYTEKLTNQAIGKVFSYHPNYVSQLIKKHTGMPLHKYILQYRINTAISYLQSGEYNVTETARLVGFADVKHFSKCFTSVAGCSPVSCRLSSF